MQTRHLAMLGVVAILAAAFSTTLSAQVTITARTLDENFAEVYGRKRQSVYSGRQVNAGYNLSVSYTGTASSSKVLTIDNRPTTCSATLDSSARLSRPMSVASRSNGTCVLTLRAPTPTAGKLTLTGFVSGGSASGHTKSTVSVLTSSGAYRKLLDGNGSLVLDVVIGPIGMKLRINGDCTSGIFGSYSTSQSLSFDTSRTRIKTSGMPCRGPVFESFYTGDLLHLQVGSIPAGNTSSLFVIGTQDINIPLPPLGCALRTDILITLGVVTTSGIAQLTLPIASPPIASVRLQYLTVSGGGWISSNQLWIKLP